MSGLHYDYKGAFVCDIMEGLCFDVPEISEYEVKLLVHTNLEGIGVVVSDYNRKSWKAFSVEDLLVKAPKGYKVEEVVTLKLIVDNLKTKEEAFEAIIALSKF